MLSEGYKAATLSLVGPYGWNKVGDKKESRLMLYFVLVPIILLPCIRQDVWLTWVFQPAMWLTVCVQDALIAYVCEFKSTQNQTTYLGDLSYIAASAQLSVRIDVYQFAKKKTA